MLRSKYLFECGCEACALRNGALERSEVKSSHHMHMHMHMHMHIHMRMHMHMRMRMRMHMHMHMRMHMHILPHMLSRKVR